MEVGTIQGRPDGPAQVGSSGRLIGAFRSSAQQWNMLHLNLRVADPEQEGVNIRKHTTVSDYSGGQSELRELRANAAAVVVKEITRTEQSKGEEASDLTLRGKGPDSIKKIKKRSVPMAQHIQCVAGQTGQYRQQK